MRNYLGFFIVGTILVYSWVMAFAGVTPINCVQNITPGIGVTVNSSNNTSPTVSLSATDTQAETFASSITVNSNFGITGAVTAPLTVTSSSTFTTNVEVDGFLQLLSRTKAQIQAITPAAVGEIYYCSDCAALRTCVSTGTAIGAFSSPVAATTVCN